MAILRFHQKNVRETMYGDVIVDDVVVNQKPQGRRVKVRAKVKAVVDVDVNRKLKQKERVK